MHAETALTSRELFLRASKKNRQTSLLAGTRTLQPVARHQPRTAGAAPSQTAPLHPRTGPASSLPTPFSHSQCERFQNDLHLLPQTPWHKAARSFPDGRHAVFSTQPCCWGFRLHAPGADPSQAAVWLNKPFRLEELSAVKVAVSQHYSFFPGRLLSLLNITALHSCSFPLFSYNPEETRSLFVKANQREL